MTLMLINAALSMFLATGFFLLAWDNRRHRTDRRLCIVLGGCSLAMGALMSCGWLGTQFGWWA